MKALTSLLLTAVAAVLATTAAPAQVLTLANPDWNITLTDFGYSDFLLDNTPGFEGREYLSGEWGAAVAYSTGAETVGPIWLEPHWIFPDWTTNSTFVVVSPITQTGLNADNLPVAESVIRSMHLGQPALEITLRHEMLDTVTGTPMGIAPASAGGAGAQLVSNRYVLKQTCTIRNVSGAPVSNVQFFQLLHGLSSQRGAYDNRAYAGALAAYSHDTTLSGVDPWSAGGASSAAGLEDYIGFHAAVAPDVYEIGHYGIEGNGVDAHGIGKPSDGVHLSVEANWQGDPYAARAGTDWFQPPQHWIAGAQRWSLGPLANGGSASIDVLLTILTGTKVVTGTGSSGSCNGGAQVPGGIDYLFEDVSTEGDCFGSYAQADSAELEVHVASGEFDPFTFTVPAMPAQIWEVEFTGTYSGMVDLSFGYDDTILPAGFDEGELAIYQFDGGTWVELAAGAVVDPLANRAHVTTPVLGHFALGVSGGAPVFTISTVAAPAEGGSVHGDGPYAAGAGVTVSATPAAGYAFAGWTEGATPVSTSPDYSFTASASRALTANFVPAGTGHVVTTQSLPENGGTTAGGGAYAAGTTATVSAVAAPGYKFSKWLEGGVTVSTSAGYGFTVTGPRALVAKFKPVYVINATPNDPNLGEVEVDPVYEPGELAKLKAVPADGCALVNWTQNGVEVNDQLIYNFTVTGNRTLVANFAEGYRVDVSADPANAGGAGGSGVHPSGSTVELTATANPGYVFRDWTEGGATVSTDPVFTFPSAAHRTLVARFLALPWLDTAPAGAGALVIAWPAAADGWVLEESTSLDAGSWTPSARPVTVSGDHKQVQVDGTAGAVFFRLSHP